MTRQSPEQQGLRARDVCAITILIYEISTAFYNNDFMNHDQSISASISLTFYIPRSSSVVLDGKHAGWNSSISKHYDTNTVLFPSVMDVDGDGTSEALAF